VTTNDETPTTKAAKPTVRIEQVGPRLADKWLGTQERNRDIANTRVAWLMGIIERGEWELTNDAISFDTTGRLLNGQHRLTAIVVSEQTLPLVILRGLPPSVQDVMDTGLVRRTADALKMRGEVQVFALAAALRWEHRLRRLEQDPTDILSFGTHGADRPTTPHLLTIFDEDPERWREMVRLSASMSRTIKVRPGVGAALFRRFFALDETDAGAFLEALMTGANLAEDDPILLLRQNLQPTRIRSRNRMPDFKEAGLICKAWNLWRDGDRRGHLVWHYGGSGKEPFPIPR
jgi:hypothetical protein